VEAGYSLRRDVIGWRQLKTIGKIIRKKVVCRQFARANNGLRAGDHPILDPISPDTEIEKKREPVEKKLDRMVKVHDLLDVLQGTQILRAT
jgi:hypothetical protein